MQIKTSLVLLFSAIVSISIAQTETRVIILSPFAHNFHKTPEKAIKKRVDSYKRSLDLNEAELYLQSAEFKKREKNIQIMQKSEVAYLKIIDEVKIISYLAEQHLSYHLLEKLENAVIEVKDLTCSGTPEDLKRIANKEKATFVINITRFDLKYLEREHHSDLAVQLFDANSDKVILERVYEGDAKNQGFEYACKEGSVDCCMNNSLSAMVFEVNKLIIANDPAMMKQKQLELEQDKVLNALLGTQIKPNSLTKIIPSTDKTIEQKNAYQVLFSPDSTKFVAFFAETVPASEGKTFRDNHKDDKNVNIITDNEMGFFSGSLPNTYSYIVYGVLYKNKWYYEKSEVTYFDAESLEKGRAIYFGYLRKWQFFSDNTANLNPEFWDGKENKGYTLQTKVIFAKVPKEETNGGMYRIVVDQMNGH